MRNLLIFLFSLLAQAVCAQMITGVVVDGESGDTIPHPALQYDGGRKAVAGDAAGRFTIQRLNDEYLTVSAVGYKTLRILIGRNTPGEMRITLKPDSHPKRPARQVQQEEKTGRGADEARHRGQEAHRLEQP